jgi:two-component system phosphate regulon response regulator PhoB
MEDRILIVAESTDARAELIKELARAGFAVHTAGTGRDALRHAPVVRPHLTLIQLVLPDLGGIEVLRRLKADPVTAGYPVAMAAEEAAEVDRVVSFTLGVEDFLVQPVSVREVVLRCQAIVRRTRSAPAPTGDDRIRFGRLDVDLEAHRVRVDDAVVSLTSLEFRLLVLLLRRKDRVQSRDVLLSDVWGMAPDVTTRTVDTHIRRLRVKLGPAGEYIETIRGVGYRFLGELPALEP